MNPNTLTTPNKLWFRRKLFGWGWTPATWQGWLVIAAYIVLAFLFAMTIDEDSPPREVVFTFLLPMTLLTIALIRICYYKGERPRWQWGRDLGPDEKNPSALSTKKVLFLLPLAILFFLGISLGLLRAMSHRGLSPLGTAPADHSSSIDRYTHPTVCASLYSGRENPCWHISRSAAEELVTLIEAAPDETWSPVPSKLGYNGFSVTLPPEYNLLSQDVIMEVVIVEGKIYYYNLVDMWVRSSPYPTDVPDPAITYKKDTDRKIEEWLLLMAREHIPPEASAVLPEMDGTGNMYETSNTITK